jgi:signal transduction histidine kinase
MARIINTVRGRLLLLLFAVQAVLMPFLFYAIYGAVKETMTDQFVDDVRSYAQVIASRFVGLRGERLDHDIVDILDFAILGGHSSYATLEIDDELYISSLMRPDDAQAFDEDFEFGAHNDGAYYLSLAIPSYGESAILRLGFDETTINENLSDAQATINIGLIAYVLACILAAGFLSSSIVNPLKRLQRASHSISSGEVDREFWASSRIVEIQELSNDLETMRRNLVGMNEQLQIQIHEREVAEAERRGMETYLRQAQRLESLGTLAGGVAHEFNNVLQPILLYTDLTLKGIPRDQPASANLRRVMDLARRAKGLTAQILTFGRHDEGQEFELTDVRQVVHEAITMIRALYPATVDIRANIGMHIGPVNCDPPQIKQVIVNLTNNAYQALTGLHDYIEITLNEVIVSKDSKNGKANIDPGEYVVLEVADTGEGMDRETQRRIFEPFFTTRNVGDGTGLGLSVVHGIVKKHGGEIVVESEPGVGTRVRVYLPLADEVTEEFNQKEEEHEKDSRH